MKLSQRAGNRAKRIELSMTSMIDVVFLLLIFFLATTAFVPPENQLRSAISYQTATDAQSPSDLEPALIEVTWVEGRLRLQMGGIITDSRPELRRVLERWPDKSGGAFIRVADDVPFDFAAKITSDCRQAGFATVTYIPPSR